MGGMVVLLLLLLRVLWCWGDEEVFVGYTRSLVFGPEEDGEIFYLA
jgi:hypothetical protein